ncbi:MAG: hypothetical protein KAK00_08730 [Nanoarchaeota archaeon]|nr:hypothetical protein [Nanoarchaeota archaeon]
MGKSSLIHIRVGKGIKREMQRLIDVGMFSTESEIAREGIRHLLIKYLKEAGFDGASGKTNNDRDENAKKK